MLVIDDKDKRRKLLLAIADTDCGGLDVLWRLVLCRAKRCYN